MKDYIDRVWDHGIAYVKGRRLPVKQVRWIGLAGYDEEGFHKQGIGESLSHCMNAGLSGICCIEDRETEYFFDT